VRAWLLEQSERGSVHLETCRVGAYEVSVKGRSGLLQAHAAEFKMAFGFSNIGKVSPVQGLDQ
jgi:hypothetical protein